MRSLVLALVILSDLVGGLARDAAAAPRKLTLAEVIDRALASPRAKMAEGDRAAAAARVDEADAARLPRAKLTAFGTASPEIRCSDATCTSTDPKQFALRFSGLFGSGQLDLTQPLYTFGKIGHARAGLDAERALADEAAGDLAVDAALSPQ
jgi:outer membrane protein TolC